MKKDVFFLDDGFTELEFIFPFGAFEPDCGGVELAVLGFAEGAGPRQENKNNLNTLDGKRPATTVLLTMQ